MDQKQINQTKAPETAPPTNTQAVQKTQPQPPIAKPNPPATQQAAKPIQEQKKFSGRKRSGVLLIGRTQLSLFIEETTSIVAFPYQQTAIRDLDVVNEDHLAQQITELIKKNQLPPTSFYAVLANPTMFARQIMATEVSEQKAEEEKFIETVPFEEVSTRRVKMDGKTYIVAANKHFYQTLDDVLKKNGSEITLILPEFLFSKEVNLAQGLNPTVAGTLLHRMSAFREYNFIQKEVPLESTSSQGQQEEKKFNLQVKGGKSNSKFVIAGSLTMIIGVLFAGFLLMQQNTPQQPTHVLKQGPAPQAVPTAAPNPPATTSGQVVPPPSNVQGAVSPTIVINYQQSQLPLANQLKARLVQDGYSAVTLQNTSIVAARTFVVFNAYLSQPLRDLITNSVNSVTGNVTVYETNSVASDVVITLSSMK